MVLFIFLLILVGTITNGMLDNMDRFWLKASSKIMPGLYANIYEANADTGQYVTKIKAIFKYDRKACDELIGKIRYQKIITRHGIAHSIILLMCLPFIFACKKINAGGQIHLDGDLFLCRLSGDQRISGHQRMVRRRLENHFIDGVRVYGCGGHAPAGRYTQKLN